MRRNISETGWVIYIYIYVGVTHEMMHTKLATVFFVCGVCDRLRIDWQELTLFVLENNRQPEDDSRFSQVSLNLQRVVHRPTVAYNGIDFDDAE